MKNYLSALSAVMLLGSDRLGLTGAETRSVFGTRLEFDLSKGDFPLVTTKAISFRLIAEELLWMLRGETSVYPLQDKGVHTWDEWADSVGELGPVYGAQWREWETTPGFYVDQIDSLLHSLKHDPYSRRHILSSWNVGDLSLMALAPRHMMCQFHVDSGYLYCQVYQRSADMFLDVPLSIASYALLTNIMAKKVGLWPGKLIWVGGDCHVRKNHFEQVETQLARFPRRGPRIEVCKEVENCDFEGLTADHFKIHGYEPYPAIEGEVSA